MTADLVGPVSFIAVPVDDSATFRAGTPSVLFRGDYNPPAAGNIGRHFDVSPDGNRFLLTKNTARQFGSPNGEIVVVLSWVEELDEGLCQ